jgi:hypothetical protein
LPEGILGETEGTVDDDFLAQRGGDDVEAAAEGGEDELVDGAADAVEPIGADEGDAAADDDPARGDECDGLRDREGGG